MIEPLRKFWLENEAGEIKPLNGEEDIVLLRPRGLGKDTDLSFLNVGNGFFLHASGTASQLPIVADLVFQMPRPHDVFTAFCEWVLRAQELTLIYMPTTIAYRRRVEISLMEKEEPDKPVAMTVPVTFLPLTPWYTNDKETYSLGVVGDGFRAMSEVYIDALTFEAPIDDDELFPLVLDGALESDDDEMEEESVVGESRVWDESTDAATCEWARLTETDALEGGFIIKPKGQVESSFLLTFTGTAITPTIYIIGVNTKTEYGRVVLSGSLNGTERLEYSTNQIDSYIRTVRNGTIRDLLDSVDLSYEVFPRLPTTEPCRVYITSAGELNGQLSVVVQRYAEVV